MSTHLDEDDSRREQVSDKDYRDIDAKLIELKRRLNDKRGSLIDPWQVLEGLQRIIEGRMVMPGDAAWTVTDGSSDRRVLPFTTAQWNQVAYLPVLGLGCTYKTSIALTEAYGTSAHYVGAVLLRSDEEVIRDCGEKVFKDLDYCLQSQLLQLPTAAELEEARDWWTQISTMDLYTRYMIEIRMPRSQLGQLPIKEISEIDHYWPTRARTEGNVTTLGELLVFAGEEALGDFLISLYSEWTYSLREIECRHKAQMVAEWVSAKGLKFAGDL